MSFGQHQYQHRFYRDKREGKAIVNRSDGTSLNPIQYERGYRSLGPIFHDTPARFQNHVLYNDPSIYDGYNDYVYNSIVLDNFKRNADYNRKYKKFGTAGGYYDYIPPPIRRVITQPPILQPTILPPSPSVLYINKDNPQALAHVHNYNTMLINRINQIEKEKIRIQAEAAKQKQEVKEYRRKYDKLKNRFREEIHDRKLKQAEIRQRKYIELEKERQKIDQIGHAMHEMKEKIINNSKIFQQNLKLKQQLQNTQQSKSRIVLFPNIPHVLTRSMVVDQPKLDTQYKEMHRLKSQIKELDKKLGYYKQ